MLIKFGIHNTSGYSPDDLRALNAAWLRIMSDGGHALTEHEDGVILSNATATLLSEYEAGKRGDDLVAWWYTDPEEGDEDDR